MTNLTLYMIIGFCFSVVSSLDFFLHPRNEEKRKEVEKSFELLPINLKGIYLLVFIIQIFTWPIGMFIMIEDIITGNKDDD